jgi:hypothetical protein
MKNIKTVAVLLPVFLLLSCSIYGQDEESASIADLISDKRFSEALPLCHEQLKFEPQDPLLNFRTGLCYLHSRSQKSKSLFYFEKAASSKSFNLLDNDAKEIDEPVIVYKFLGDAYFYSGKFESALVSYEKYSQLLRKLKDQDSCASEEIARLIALCRKEKEAEDSEGATVYAAQKNSIGFELQREDHQFFEDSPIPQANDTLLTEKKDDLRLKGFIIQPSPDTNKNEATLGTSIDGQIILIYRDEKGNAKPYSSYLNGNVWTGHEKVNNPINTKGWETDEFILADGSVLFFTSRRPGGFGGKDIYKCVKLKDGNWGKATNLGPSINTVEDEEAPFIFPDGVTLYFSSKGHDTTGVFNIYSSTLKDPKTWTEPINVGYPIHEKE